MTLHVDFETFSRVDLKTSGAYRYAQDPSTEVLLFAWAVDAGPVTVAERLDDPRLEQVRRRVAAGETVTAHNAQFERAVWLSVLSERHGWPAPALGQWDCTAARAAARGYPRALAGAAIAMGLKVGKDPRGEKLIRQFSMPDRTGQRIYDAEAPIDWTAFMQYCAQDVVVEQELAKQLPPLNAFERRVFLLDADMNDYGFPIDVPLVKKALAIVREFDQRLRKRATELTDGIAPTQRNAILQWLQEEGADIQTLQAQEVKDLLLDKALPPHLREVLEIRLEAGKAGVKKLAAMLNAVCLDGRVRGGFLHYGAGTGRWAGRLVQPHNFPRGDAAGQDTYLELVSRGDSDLLEILYSRPMAQMSASMRGFIKAPDGARFDVADYSAIEARGLAWVADERVMLERYRRHEDVYRAMAMEVYRVAQDRVTNEQRRIGKNLVLGAGYQLSGGKFPEFCASQGVHVTKEFGERAIQLYRQSVPRIVQYWSDVESAAIKTVTTHKSVTLRSVTFECADNMFQIQLPSGRALCYPQPAVEEDSRGAFPRWQLTFGREFGGRWLRESTYGGKLVENIVQAIARDLMVEGMWTARKSGMRLAMTVHDEIVVETPEEAPRTAQDFAQLISRVPEWATGMPLEAKGFTCKRYRKGD
jgi:DNA polymerase bacteriophage-type